MSTSSRQISVMSWAGSKERTATKKDAAITRRSAISGSSTQIWKSRLSWRITLAVFLTILTVQIGIMSVTIENSRQSQLSQLTEEGRAAIVPLIHKNRVGTGVVPFEDEKVTELTNLTRVQGLAVYTTLDGLMLRSYGQPAIIGVERDQTTGAISLPNNYYSTDGSFYDVLFTPKMLGGAPYYVIAKLDSTHVEKGVNDYIEQTILIMLLMSAFVTTVLMIALGHWLLEPILFMRDNLIRASDNPENPKIPDSPFDPNDEIGGSIEIAQNLIRQNAHNIRQIKSAAQDQIHKLAYYDTLTGLPNRIMFLQTLNDKARNSDSESPVRFAVIALDLDHFKDVNDSMGHNIGDAILRAVGKRLRSSMPESAVVARSGEDEFAITMPLSRETGQAKDIAERVANVIRAEPFKVFNENFQIRSSIGVATFPDDGTDPDQVLKNADIALNRAKEEGRDTIKEYSEDFDRAVQQRFQMLRDLRDAMEQDQLLLFFQPQFDLKSGRIIGAEALIRWWKPDNSKEGGHFISPADFIPIAEQSGLIVPIGEWVLQTACNAAAKWQQEGRDMRIAVNVSGAQFYKSDIVALTDKILRETGLEPRRLELEVTESVFMEDVSHAIQTLQNLHGLGVEIAIDDFGTGYSSLSYLRQFPIDRLKIDQSFIRNALNNPDDAAIARTIVRLGHSLNLKVIAEGVETSEHEAFLLAEECDEVQGFRYSKPVNIDDFNAFAAGYNGDFSSFN
ncbi:MAG: EAL domain-containing protein [Rhodospirillales bacterium]|nr:EAL domain-containing protein [Rhodospirillales bacterium]MCB9996098.1 EAL domain-containing protein [Rhodospirillales bacterium]